MDVPGPLLDAFQAIFGAGDSDHPWWLLVVRMDILLFAALALAAAYRAVRHGWGEIRVGDLLALAGLTLLAGILRIGVVEWNVLDHGGIAYSRMLWGYMGYFGVAQLQAPWLQATTRDLEHAVAVARVLSTLTVPAVYVLMRFAVRGPLLPAALSAFLLAVFPLHVLAAASTFESTYCLFVAAVSWGLIAAATGLPADRATDARLRYAAGFLGIALATQMRVDGALLLIPPAVWLVVRRRDVRAAHLLPALAVGLPFLAFFAACMAGSGLVRNAPPASVAREWADIVDWVLLNPLFLAPVLFAGSCLAFLAGPTAGVLALLAWVLAFGPSLLAQPEAHHKARMFLAHLLPLLLFPAWGVHLLTERNERWGRAATALAIVLFGLLPVAYTANLQTPYLERRDHEAFRAALEAAPPDTAVVVVPDDSVMRRELGTTHEYLNKYLSIPVPPRLTGVRVVGMTGFMEHPESFDCTTRTCVFYEGMSCAAEDHEVSVVAASSLQCRRLVETRGASVAFRTTSSAPPFLKCTLATGALRATECRPTAREVAFTLHVVR